jgi:hypothetical protein
MLLRRVLNPGRGAELWAALKGFGSELRARRPSASSRRWDGAEPTLSGMKLLHRVLEVGGREVGPAPVREIKLGVSTLPEEEVAQTLFASGADEEVDIPHLARPVIHVAHRARKILSSYLSDATEPVHRPHHRVARRIINGNPEIEPRTVTRCILCHTDGAQELGRDAIATSDYAHPDVVRDAAIGFGYQVASEQPHQESDFPRRARPVVRGECVEGQHPDSAIRRGLDDFPNDARAGDVSSSARASPSVRPPPIPVHDDSDVDSGLRRGRLRNVRVGVAHCVTAVGHSQRSRVARMSASM